MSNPFAHKGNEEIRALWQARALHAACGNGKLFRVLLIAMTKEYSAVTVNTWAVILRIIIPGFEDIARPFYSSHAIVVQSGKVVCEAVQKDGTSRTEVVYRNKDEFISEMRRHADRLNLSDVERVDMFAVMGRWIAADYRVDVHGEKRMAS